MIKRALCFLLGHAWDKYINPERRAEPLLLCRRCGMVSTPMGDQPTVAREPTDTEKEFLRQNFYLVWPRDRKF